MHSVHRYVYGVHAIISCHGGCLCSLLLLTQYTLAGCRLLHNTYLCADARVWVELGLLAAQLLTCC
jgi:hypothetical protein